MKRGVKLKTASRQRGPWTRARGGGPAPLPGWDSQEVGCQLNSGCRTWLGRAGGGPLPQSAGSWRGQGARGGRPGAKAGGRWVLQTGPAGPRLATKAHAAGSARANRRGAEPRSGVHRRGDTAHLTAGPRATLLPRRLLGTGPPWGTRPPAEGTWAGQVRAEQGRPPGPSPRTARPVPQLHPRHRGVSTAPDGPGPRLPAPRPPAGPLARPEGHVEPGRRLTVHRWGPPSCCAERSTTPWWPWTLLPDWPGPLGFHARARDRPSGSPAPGPRGGRRKPARGDSVLTSTMAFREVSEPRLRSVPGTLLLMVAGRTQMGTQNSWWSLRASANKAELSKA